MDQIKDKVGKYENACIAHQKIYGVGFNADQGLLHNIRKENQNIHLADNKMQKQLATIDIEWIDAKSKAIQDSMKNIDKVVEIINYPNILNQCLQQNQLVQATKIIRHYEKNVKLKLNLKMTSVMELLDKEMGILKSKLIKVIYIKLESSFISEKSTF